ncbi:MAG: hypothetical protein AB1782_14250 [Cyanobacteriota bacterium]
MRKNAGSALFDYIVPTLVVGIVGGLAIYALYNSGNLLKYLTSSANMQVDQKTKTAIIPIEQTSKWSVAANNLNLNNANFNMNNVICNGNICDIDYGGYILTGIPSDNSVFSETVGSPGITSDQSGVFGSVLQQVSDAIHNSDPEASKLISLLSKSTNIISDKQKLMKDYNGQCIGKTTLFFFNSDNGQKLLQSELSSFGYNNATPNTFKTFLPAIGSNNNLALKNQALPPDLDRTKLLSMTEDDLNKYLNDNPEKLASVYYGIWNEIQNSQMSKETREAVNLTASEIAKMAGSIDMYNSTKKSGGILGFLTKKYYFNVNFKLKSDFSVYFNKLINIV